MNNPDKSEKEADFIQRETSVALREKEVQADRQAIEAEKAKLTEREKAIIIAEQKRDAGFADERAALNNELRDKRNQVDAEISNIRAKKLLELDDEVAKLKSTRLDEISNAENMERERTGEDRCWHEALRTFARSQCSLDRNDEPRRNHQVTFGQGA